MTHVAIKDNTLHMTMQFTIDGFNSFESRRNFFKIDEPIATMFACIRCHGIMLDGTIFHFTILAKHIIQDFLGNVDTILNITRSQGMVNQQQIRSIFPSAMYVPNGKRNSQEL